MFLDDFYHLLMVAPPCIFFQFQIKPNATFPLLLLVIFPWFWYQNCKFFVVLLPIWMLIVWIKWRMLLLIKTSYQRSRVSVILKLWRESKLLKLFNYINSRSYQNLIFSICVLIITKSFLVSIEIMKQKQTS